jgi:hypothetical protein
MFLRLYHLHSVWTLPPDDANFSTRWRLIKTRFAKALPKQERLSAVRKARNERGIWQRRFWEHLIRDDADYARHIEYCYINPVKHGLVTRVRDWPHSSFHRDVRADLFPEDWARRFGRGQLRRACSRAATPTAQCAFACCALRTVRTPCITASPEGPGCG